MFIFISNVDRWMKSRINSYIFETKVFTDYHGSMFFFVVTAVIIIISYTSQFHATLYIYKFLREKMIHQPL